MKAATRPVALAERSRCTVAGSRSPRSVSTAFAADVIDDDRPTGMATLPDRHANTEVRRRTSSLRLMRRWGTTDISATSVTYCPFDTTLRPDALLESEAVTGQSGWWPILHPLSGRNHGDVRHRSIGNGCS